MLSTDFCRRNLRLEFNSNSMSYYAALSQRAGIGGGGSGRRWSRRRRRCCAVGAAFCYVCGVATPLNRRRRPFSVAATAQTPASTVDDRIGRHRCTQRNWLGFVWPLPSFTEFFRVCVCVCVCICRATPVRRFLLTRVPRLEWKKDRNKVSALFRGKSAILDPQLGCVHVFEPHQWINFNAQPPRVTRLSNP